MKIRGALSRVSWLEITDVSGTSLPPSSDSNDEKEMITETSVIFKQLKQPIARE
jgi:hypothetical protein